MTISLVATVLNEGESIRRLMDSILAQTCQPDEIVIVDGGSTDNTVAILQSYVDQLPLHVYVESDCNISRGRNAAIEAAQGDIIAVTDAGVGLPPNWLECLTQPLLDDPNCQVVGGFFRAAPHNVFEAAMGATVLPLRDEINPANFLPSSRSIAFRKSAWEAVDGYPEWLDYCEDLVFDLRLKQRFGSFAFAPDAVVDFRPRGSLEALFTQYYLYARGDGKADLWRKRHAIRYATYLVAIPAILLLALYVHPLLILLYLPGAAIYLYQPYRRLPTVLKTLPEVSPRDRLRAIALIPVIRVVGDLAKMMGYPEGWRWRREVQPPDWREIPEPAPKSV
jgi:glycosyltransferase involved in cell wall biosynthesis